jgi:HAD superfamily hydrolase (TIGR01509 family)
MTAAVIFDMDGTLIDTVDLHASSWQRTFARFGHEIAYDAIRAQIGKGGDQLMPALLPGKVVDRHGADMEKFRADLFKRAYMPRVKAFPKVRELFLRIQADGGRVALASSSKADELAVFKKAAGIDDLVDEETCSADADRSKPFPDIFEAALDQLGIAPSAAVVIGDSPYDAEAAAKAGIATIGVLCGGFGQDELEEAGCRQIFQDPADLLAHYDASLLAPPDALAAAR